MCQTSDEIESRPPLMAIVIEIRRTVKALLRELQPPQPEEAHGAASNARHG